MEHTWCSYRFLPGAFPRGDLGNIGVWGLRAESLGAATSGSASLLVLHKAGEANTESIEEAEGG
jgi:hypothetical protein